MSRTHLRVQVFVVGATLSIAMLLFAAQKHDAQPLPQFRSVIDLTAPASNLASPGTVIIAPAKVGGVWTVDALPALRLVAPLVVIRAEHKKFPDSESLLTMEDVASYERVYGPVPQGAVVLLDSSRSAVTPHFEKDALRFLLEARNVVGVGNAGQEIISPELNSYVAGKGVYQLQNVSGLSLLSRSGAIAVVAPQKTPGAAAGPARVMALLK